MKGIDQKCIDFIDFFNSNGLQTAMSCEGHPNSSMHVYWISFTKNIKDEDIENFMLNFEQPFYSKNKITGKFTKVLYGYIDGAWDYRWRYVCNTYPHYKRNQMAAERDLECFISVFKERNKQKEEEMLKLLV